MLCDAVPVPAPPVSFPPPAPAAHRDAGVADALFVIASEPSATALGAAVSPFDRPSPSAAARRPSGVAPLGDGTAGGNLHDRASRAVLLERLAALLDCPVRPDPCGSGATDPGLLLVPGETMGAEAAAAAGIRHAHQLLGGAVPAAFVGTKSIAHGLVDVAAARPPLWSDAMHRAMDDAALNGFTAFTRADAARAGRRLLAAGPVRIKDVCGKAGLGQSVVRSTAELDAALAAEDADELAAFGIVLEEDLVDVVTYSVGTTEVCGRHIAYWGRQNLVRDHRGRSVYGGTDLVAVPGGLDALLDHLPTPSLARAVACAAAFDWAAQLAYPDVLLTRRNYDVIEGTDAGGRPRIGVLEQSWRVGGATGAELAAFEAFACEPALARAHCSTVEIYGDAPAPLGAATYFRGTDPVVGPMTKYAMRTA